MNPPKPEIDRRTSLALSAIRNEWNRDADGSPVKLFVTHHVSEIEPAYWVTHCGTPQPTPAQVLAILELQSHWGGEGDDDEGIDVFDFTLPDNVTQYVIAVRFGDDGDIAEIDMES